MTFDELIFLVDKFASIIHFIIHFMINSRVINIDCAFLNIVLFHVLMKLMRPIRALHWWLKTNTL